MKPEFTLHAIAQLFCKGQAKVADGDTVQSLGDLLTDNVVQLVDQDLLVVQDKGKLVVGASSMVNLTSLAPRMADVLLTGEFDAAYLSDSLARLHAQAKEESDREAIEGLGRDLLSRSASELFRGRNSTLLAEFVPEKIFEILENAKLDQDWDWDSITRALAMMSQFPGMTEECALLLAKFAGKSDQAVGYLREMFLFWIRNLPVTDPKRLEVLRKIVENHADVGTRLCLSVLPHGQGMSSGLPQPRYRKLSEDELPKISKNEAFEYLKHVCDVLSSALKKHPDLIVKAVERVSKDFTHYVETLATTIKDIDWTKGQAQVAKEKAYAALHTQIERHRTGARWALEEAERKLLECALTHIGEPESLLRHVHLFGWNPNLPGYLTRQDHQENERQTIAAQDDVVREAMQRANGSQERALELLLDVAREAQVPAFVGRAWASVCKDQLVQKVLAMAEAERPEYERNFAHGYVMKRADEAGWAENQLTRLAESNKSLAVRFAYSLPELPKTWNLLQKIGEPIEQVYWKGIGTFRLFRQADYAVKKFLEFGETEKVFLTAADAYDLYQEEDNVNPAEMLEHAWKALEELCEKARNGVEFKPVSNEFGQRVYDFFRKVRENRENQESRIASKAIEELYDLQARVYVYLTEPTYEESEYVDYAKRMSKDATYCREAILTPELALGFDDRSRLSEAQQERLGTLTFMIAHEWSSVPCYDYEREELDLEKVHEWKEELLADVQEDDQNYLLHRLGQCLGTLKGWKSLDWIQSEERLTDNVWLFIEDIDRQDFSRGVATGVFNSYGMRSYGPESGKILREEAGKYEARAKEIRSAVPKAFPNVAEVLRSIASSHRSTADSYDATFRDLPQA